MNGTGGEYDNLSPQPTKSSTGTINKPLYISAVLETDRNEEVDKNISTDSRLLNKEGPGTRRRRNRFSCVEKFLIIFTFIVCIFVAFSTVYVVILVTTHEVQNPRSFTIQEITALKDGNIYVNTGKAKTDDKLLQSLFTMISKLKYNSPMFDIYLPDDKISLRELLRLDKSSISLKWSRMVDLNEDNYIENKERISKEEPDNDNYAVVINKLKCDSVFSPIVRISDIADKKIYIDSPNVKLETSNLAFEGNVIFKDVLKVLNSPLEPGYDLLPENVETQFNIYTNYNNIGGIKVEGRLSKRELYDENEENVIEEEKYRDGFSIMYPINVNGENSIELSYNKIVLGKEDVKSSNTSILISSPATSYINTNLKDVSELRYGSISISGNKMMGINKSMDSGGGISNILLGLDTIVEHDIKSTSIDIDGVIISSFGIENGETKVGFSKNSLINIKSIFMASNIQIASNNSSKSYIIKVMDDSINGKGNIDLDFKTVEFQNIGVTSILVNDMIRFLKNGVETINLKNEDDNDMNEKDENKTLKIGSKFVAGEVFANKKKIYLKEIIAGSISIKGDSEKYGHTIVLSNAETGNKYIGMASLETVNIDDTVEVIIAPEYIYTARNEGDYKNNIKINEDLEDLSTLNINGISFGVTFQDIAFIKSKSDNDIITMKANDIMFETPYITLNELVRISPTGLYHNLLDYDYDMEYPNNFALFFDNYIQLSILSNNDVKVSTIISDYDFDTSINEDTKKKCVIFSDKIENYDTSAILTIIDQSSIDFGNIDSVISSTGTIIFENSVSVDRLSLDSQLLTYSDSEISLIGVSNNINESTISIITKNSEDSLNPQISIESSFANRFNLNFSLVFETEEGGELNHNGSILLNRIKMNENGIIYVGDLNLSPKLLHISGLLDYRYLENNDEHAEDSLPKNTPILPFLSDEYYYLSQENKIIGKKLSFKLLDNLNNTEDFEEDDSRIIESCVVFNFIHFCTIIDRINKEQYSSIFHRNYYSTFDKDGNIKNGHGLYSPLFVEGEKLSVINDNNVVGNDIKITSMRVIGSLNFRNWSLINKDRANINIGGEKVENVLNLDLVLKENIDFISNKSLIIDSNIFFQNDVEILIGNTNMTKIHNDPSSSILYIGGVDDKDNTTSILFDIPITIKTDIMSIDDGEDTRMKIIFEDLNYIDKDGNIVEANNFASISCFASSDLQTDNYFDNSLSFPNGVQLSPSEVMNIGDIVFFPKYLDDEIPRIEIFVKNQDLPNIMEQSIRVNTEKLLIGSNILIDISNNSIGHFFMGASEDGGPPIANSIVFGNNIIVSLDTLDLTGNANGEKLLNINYESFVPISISKNIFSIEFLDENGQYNNSISKIYLENPLTSSKYTVIFDTKICGVYSTEIETKDLTLENQNTLHEDGEFKLNVIGNINTNKIKIGDILFGDEILTENSSISTEAEVNKVISGIKDDETRGVMYITSLTLTINTIAENRIYINKISKLEFFKTDPDDTEQILDISKSYSSIVGVDNTNHIKEVGYSKYEIHSGRISPASDPDPKIELGVPGGTVDLNGVKIILGEGVSTEIQINNISKIGELSFSRDKKEYIGVNGEILTTYISSINFGDSLVLKNTQGENPWIRTITSDNICINGSIDFSKCIDGVINKPSDPSYGSEQGIMLENCLIGDVEISKDDLKPILISGIKPFSYMTDIKFDETILKLNFVNTDKNNNKNGGRLSIKLFHLMNIEGLNPNIEVFESGINMKDKIFKIKNNFPDGDINATINDNMIIFNNIITSIETINEQKYFMIKRNNIGDISSNDPIYFNMLSEGNYFIKTIPLDENRPESSLLISNDQTDLSRVLFTYSMNSRVNDAQRNDVIGHLSNFKLESKTSVIVKNRMNIKNNLISLNSSNFCPNIYIFDISTLEVINSEKNIAEILKVMHDNNTNAEKSCLDFDASLKAVPHILISGSDKKSISFNGQLDPKNVKVEDLAINILGPNVILGIDSLNISSGNFKNINQEISIGESQRSGNVLSVVNAGKVFVEQIMFEGVGEDEKQIQNVMFLMAGEDFTDVKTRINAFYNIRKLDDYSTQLIPLKEGIKFNLERLWLNGISGVDVKESQKLAFVIDSNPKTEGEFRLDISEVSCYINEDLNHNNVMIQKQNHSFNLIQHAFVTTNNFNDATIKNYYMGEAIKEKIRKEKDMIEFVQFDVITPIILLDDFMVESSTFISPSRNSITFNIDGDRSVRIPSIFVAEASYEINRDTMEKSMDFFSITRDGISFIDEDLAYPGKFVLKTKNVSFSSNDEQDDLINVIIESANNDVSLEVNNLLAFCGDLDISPSNIFEECMTLQEDGETNTYVLQTVFGEDTLIDIQVENFLVEVPLFIQEGKEIQISDSTSLNPNENNYLIIGETNITRQLQLGEEEFINIIADVKIVNEATILESKSQNGSNISTKLFLDGDSENKNENEGFILNDLTTKLAIDTEDMTRIRVGNSILFDNEGFDWSEEYKDERSLLLNDVIFTETGSEYRISLNDIDKLIMAGYYIVDGDVSTSEWITKVEMRDDREINSNLQMPLCTNVKYNEGEQDKGNLCISDDKYNKDCEISGNCGLYSIAPVEGNSDRLRFAVNVTDFSTQNLSLYEQIVNEDINSKDPSDRRTFVTFNHDLDKGLMIDFKHDLDLDTKFETFIFTIKRIINEKVSYTGEISGTEFDVVSLNKLLDFGVDRGKAEWYYMGNDKKKFMFDLLGTESEIHIDTRNLEQDESLSGINHIPIMLFSEFSENNLGGYTLLKSKGASSDIQVKKLNVYNNYGYSDIINNNTREVMSIVTGADIYNLEITTEGYEDNSFITLSGIELYSNSERNIINVPTKHFKIKNNFVLKLDYPTILLEYNDETMLSTFLENYIGNSWYENKDVINNGERILGRPLISYEQIEKNGLIVNKEFVVNNYLLLGDNWSQNQEILPKSGLIFIEGNIISLDSENSSIDNINIMDINIILFGNTETISPKVKNDTKTVLSPIYVDENGIQEFKGIKLGKNIKTIDFIDSINISIIGESSNDDTTITDDVMNIYSVTEFNENFLRTSSTKTNTVLTFSGAEVVSEGINSLSNILIKRLPTDSEMQQFDAKSTTDLTIDNENIDVDIIYENKSIDFDLHLESISKSFWLETQSSNDETVLRVRSQTHCLNINGLVLCSEEETSGDIQNVHSQISVYLAEQEAGTTYLDAGSINLVVDSGGDKINFNCFEPDSSCGITTKDIFIEEEIVIGTIRISADGLESVDGENPPYDFKVNNEKEDLSIDIKTFNIIEIFSMNILDPELPSYPQILNISNNQENDTREYLVDIISPYIDELKISQLTSSDLNFSIFYNNKEYNYGEALVFVGKPELEIKSLKCPNCILSGESDVYITDKFLDAEGKKRNISVGNTALFSFEEEKMTISAMNISQYSFKTKRMFLTSEFIGDLMGDSNERKVNYNVKMSGNSSEYFNMQSALVPTIFNKLHLDTLGITNLDMKAMKFNENFYLKMIPKSVMKQYNELKARSNLIYRYPEALDDTTADTYNVWNLVTNFNITLSDNTNINSEYNIKNLSYIHPFLKLNSNEGLWYKEGGWTSTDFKAIDRYRYGDIEAGPSVFKFNEIQLGFISLIIPLHAGNAERTLSYNYRGNGYFKNDSFYVSGIKRGFILVNIERGNEDDADYYHCTFLIKHENISDKTISTHCPHPSLIDEDLHCSYSINESIVLTCEEFTGFRYELFGVMVDYNGKKK